MTSRLAINVKMQQNLLPIFTIFMLCVCQTPRSLIAQMPPHPYENINSFQLFQTLERPCSQYAQNVSLNSVLKNIANVYEVAIWIDRRVDIGQLISVSTNDEDTVKSVLQTISSKSNCEIAYLNQIVYVAPNKEAAKIEFAYWQVFSNSFSLTKLATSQEWSWQKVTSPHELIMAKSKELSLELPDISLIEHDLWAPYCLPTSNFAAHWTCILAGFDLAIQSDLSNAASFQRLSEPKNVEFEYTQKQILAVGKTSFAQWQSHWPKTSLKRSATREWLIDAPVAAHRELIYLANVESITASSKKASKANDNKSSSRKGENSAIENSRFTLKVTGNVGNVLNAIKQQTKLEVTPWPLPETIATKQISLDLKQARVDELLQAIAKEANVDVVRRGMAVSVQAR